MKKISKRKSMHIAIGAGGTGGHIIPALVVAEEIMNDGYDVLFITDKKNFDKVSYFESFLCNKRFTLHQIDLTSSMSWIGKLTKIPSTIICIFKLMSILRKNKISLSVGFGSYVSLPLTIATFMLNKIAIIHEQNARIGLANKLSLMFAKHCMISFPTTHGVTKLFKKRVIFTGLPLRKTVRNLHYKNNIELINYEAFLNIYDKMNIVIMGGSQGASSFQKFIPRALSTLPEEIRTKLRVHHQCGVGDIANIKKIYAKASINAQIGAFFTKIPEIMSCAHILISRAGAGAIFEIIALGTPSVLVPYPSAADNHQMLNAQYLYENGGAILLEEKYITSKTIRTLISKLYANNAELFKLSTNAKALVNIEGHQNVINVIKSCLGHDIHKPKKKSKIISGEVGFC